MCFHYSTHTSQLMSSMHRLFYISVICINVLYSVSSYPVATMKLCIETESILTNILCFMLMYVCFIVKLRQGSGKDRHGMGKGEITKLIQLKEIKSDKSDN